MLQQPLITQSWQNQVMIFGSRQMRAKLQFHSLSFMGEDIVPTDTAKDLGVILDSNLTYDEHVIKTASSCMSRLGQKKPCQACFWQTYTLNDY